MYSLLLTKGVVGISSDYRIPKGDIREVLLRDGQQFQKPGGALTRSFTAQCTKAVKDKILSREQAEIGLGLFKDVGSVYVPIFILKNYSPKKELTKAQFYLLTFLLLLELSTAVRFQFVARKCTQGMLFTGGEGLAPSKYYANFDRTLRQVLIAIGFGRVAAGLILRTSSIRRLRGWEVDLELAVADNAQGIEALSKDDIMKAAILVARKSFARMKKVV